jgi:tetratricopeptide (TPR) repeat protein
MKVHFKISTKHEFPYNDKDENYFSNFYKGEIEEEKRNFESAIEYYEKCLTYIPDDIYALKKIAKMYERLKNYEKIIESCTIYFSVNPSDSNFLFILSYYSRLLNKYEDSIEYGERYRLRDPSNIDNLNNLIISYQEIGNTDRAGRIQELLLSIQ